MRGNYAQHSLRDRTCFIYSCGDRGQLLLVACQYDVPAQRAVALTKALMREVQPKHVSWVKACAGNTCD